MNAPTRPRVTLHSLLGTHPGIPVNHLAVMRSSVASERPDVVREVHRLLKESRAAADLPGGDRRFSVDELFDEARDILGSEAD